MADIAHDSHAQHGHSPHLAHHFDTPHQQFASGKLGMWLFLATEVLLFGGLFCWYAIYRANHPEVFLYAHKALDPLMGAINTVVLLVSSFTMAAGVYCAQRSLTRPLIICLSLTLLGGAGFMTVKYFEYKAKFEHKYLWGVNYAPHGPIGGHGVEATREQHHDDPGVPANAAAAEAGQPAHPGEAQPAGHESTADAPPPSAESGESPAAPGAAQVSADPARLLLERSNTLPAPTGPPGLVGVRSQAVQTERQEVHNVQIFFGIYFLMTGLHGVHVLAGMAVIAWLLFRAIRGDFSSEYFTPVDLGGLYWHLVDLIWIYLFPLLYLIG